MYVSFEQFKHAVDAVRAGFVLLEPLRNQVGKLHDFMIVYMNDEACRTSGAPKDISGVSFLQLTHLNRQSALFELFAGAVESGQSGKLHARLNLVDGSISDELYDITCIPYQFGLSVTWVEKTKTVKKTEYTINELFENWTNSFAVFELVSLEDETEDLRLLSANRTFANLIEHDYETLPGKLFTEVCQAAIEWLPFYIKTAKTGTSSMNESYNYELKKYLTAIEFSPAIGQIALIVLDRTHLWKTENELRKRKNDLTTLFSSMASGFCVGSLVRNSDGEVIDAFIEMANPAYELMEGFPTSTVQGKYLSELGLDARCLEQYIQIVESQGKITFTKFIPTSGATLEVLLFSHGDDGFVCVENDVSARVKAELELAKSQATLAEQHQIIMNSIQYASKIQRNTLPQTDAFQQAFSDHAVIWVPRDIVGGDIYWLQNFDAGSVLCVCDCTGHGTPGAFLTMLVVSAFDAIVNESNWMDPAEIMWQLEQRLVQVLNVQAEDQISGMELGSDIKDGCDLAVLSVAKEGHVALASGNTRVFVCDGKEVMQIKGQKIFIGEGRLKRKNDLKVLMFLPNHDNKYYVASDGFFDQIGWQAHRPFGYHLFKQIILENHSEKLDVTAQKLWDAFERHRGEERRRDDVQLIAFQK